jgi:hypothetical protein
MNSIPLKNLLNTSNSQSSQEENTELIRQLKHSIILENQIDKMLELRDKYDEKRIDEFHFEAMYECSFLYTYYTDIYNKIKKNEIDIALLKKFIYILREIEDEKINEYEGSVKVGEILKKIHIDSAINKANKLNEIHKDASTAQLEPVSNITWKDYKLGVGKHDI